MDANKPVNSDLEVRDSVDWDGCVLYSRSWQTLATPQVKVKGRHVS